MQYIITDEFGKYSLLTEDHWYAMNAYPIPKWQKHKECIVSEEVLEQLSGLGEQQLLAELWRAT